MMIEQNTNYAYKLKYMDNPTFDKVRDLSTKFYRELPQALQDELFEALNRGIDILDSEPQMTAYLFAFGKMHQAKLNYAFGKLPKEFLEQPEINIIDYGCGQALGTMCYADFLRENGYAQNVKAITLIEPSEICMKRAALHASVFFPNAEIKTVNKKFDDLTQEDIVCNEETPTLHILSNVLDMMSFNLERFAELVKGCLKGYNQFVCVGPYFGKNDRSKRIDDFANNLMEGIIYTVDLNSFEFDPNYSWTCMVRCFGVGNLGIALHKEKAGTVNSNVKPSFTNFMSFKGLRKVFIGVKSIINPETNQKESWQELILGESKDDPNAEIIRISSKLGTINANFLISNKDKLQVASHPDWKYKRLCIEDRPVSTLRENLSTEVTIKDIENGIEDKFGVVYSEDGKRLLGINKYGLKVYNIKNGTKVICDYAFALDAFADEGFLIPSLQSIFIPETVTSIGESAFKGCESLQSIVIPNSVTSIGKTAFSGCESLQSIVIPNSVTSIGDSAFSGCESLQSIVIPNSVTSIGDSAFSLCTSLQSIVIPNSVTSIGEKAFLLCTSLQSIAIPESVTSIGEKAFSFCTSLQSIVIPKSVTSIGKKAFPFCTSLQSIAIPESVTSIGANPFVDSGIRSIACHSKFFKVDGKALYDQNKKHLIAFYSNCSHFVIPGSVTSIGNLAFYDCNALQSIVIPNSVTSIGDNAFYDCASLQSIVIPNSVTNIGDSAFGDCKSLQSIVIPESVTGIGANPFENSGVRSIVSHSKFFTVDRKALYDQKKKLLIACFSKGYHFVIPDNVTSIGDRAFRGCESLQSIVIPNSVTCIGAGAFASCYSLQSIVIPNSVTSIGGNAFSGCKSLQSIVIPKGRRAKFKKMLDKELWDKLVEE